jgi:hypothetical protein
MADVQPLNDDERAELVAYLDGELDQRASRAVEARLNRDAKLRGEADALRRTWELLDFLPRPEPSPNFTRQTVTRASILQPALRASPWRWRRWVLGLTWAAALVVAGVVGYASVPGRPKAPPPPTPAEKGDDTDQQLARDLRLLDQLRTYQQAGDINFLRELERTDLFADDHRGN